MKASLVLALSFLALAPVQQEDWCEEMRKMSEDVNKIQGPLYLLRSLRQEMLRSTKALDESRLDLADLHLLRLAQVSRTYNENHANQVVSLALALRAEVRAEGVARVLAVAEDLKNKRVKEAGEKIELALNTPYLATTYRAEFERLKPWLETPPAPAAVEAEVARWRGLMPPGGTSNCSPCSGKGEIDCPTCQNGWIEEPCRHCAGKGAGSCLTCAGKGKLAHGGFGGMMRLVVPEPFEAWVIINGKKRKAKFPAQRIIWSFKPCTGSGSCDLATTSTPLDGSSGERKAYKLTCAEVFDQLKLYVFNGRALMFKSDKDKDVLTAEEAKRFFAEYEKCKSGHTVCDACDGKTTGKCAPCLGMGLRVSVCSTCSGAATLSCTTCRTSGDSSWLAAKIPASRVPALGACLDNHVKALVTWRENRAKERVKSAGARDRLARARQGLDPNYDFTVDRVKVTCAKCVGKGEVKDPAGGKPLPCEECWSVGRREYASGTPVWEQYAALRKLEDQVAKLSKASHGVSSDDIQLRIDDAAVDSEFKLPPAAKDPPPEPPKPPPGGGLGGRIADLPEDLKAELKKADELHEEGKKAYDRAIAAREDDNEKRRTEAVHAKECFWKAMEIHSRVLEALDDRAIKTPQELNDKASINRQALKLAKNLAF